MKIRTVVISVIVTASLIGGAGYGAWYSLQSRKKPVDVVPVENVNFGFWGDTSSSSGTIISQSIQNVRLDGDKTLIKVYVQEGDEVKIGDPLLEYDMTLTQLQREMEDLGKQTLELNLKSLQKNLEKWKNTTPSASLELSEPFFTAVSDEFIEDDGEPAIGEDNAGGGEGTAQGTGDGGGNNESTAGSNGDSGNSGSDTDSGNSGSGDSGSGNSGNGGFSSGNSDNGDSGSGSSDNGDSGSGAVENGDDGGSGSGAEEGGDNGGSGSGAEENRDNGGSGIIRDDNGGGSDSDSRNNGDEDHFVSDDGNGDGELVDPDAGSSDDGPSELVDPDEESQEEEDWDSLIEDDGEITTDGKEISPTVLKNVNRFLARVNLLPEEDELDQLFLPDIEQTLKTFRKKLAAVEKEKIARDLLGEKRTKKTYTLKPKIAEMVGEDTAKILTQSYEKTCIYQFIYRVNEISADRDHIDELGNEAVRGLETQIREALDAYYQIPAEGFEDYQELLSPYQEKLGLLIVRLRDMDVVEEPESQSEESESETDDYGYDDYGDYDGYDMDDYDLYTAEEIKEMIETLEMDIEECELDIRESELKLKQFDRELDKRIVKSTMNGVVISAGSENDDAFAENFIVISGEAGMYVQGTLNELELDTVSIGDTVQGVSYETGMNFVATITEISDFPTERNDYYYWGSSGNSNASYYTFLAYIENTEGLEEGEVELQIVSSTPSTGIYLEEYFIRSENGNKKYVFIQGEDGLLKKQYVETGTTIYGEVEIRKGLSRSDKIAFPYGKDVVEGAQTREVDNLDSAYGYYY